MKRQTGSVSMEAQEDVEQSKRKESKRLKLLHRPDGDYASLGEGSSLTCPDKDSSSQVPENVPIDNNVDQSENNFTKHNNGAVAKNIDSSNSELSPKTNGTNENQHLPSLESNAEPSDSSHNGEVSPFVLFQQNSISDEAVSNGNMNITESEYSIEMPKLILEEDSNGDSSQSDTDIENSHSPNGASEVNKENFFSESTPEELKLPNKCIEPPNETVSPNTHNKVWNFDVENLTSSLLQVTQLEGHADFVHSVAADEDIVISSSGDTTIKVWNVFEKSELCSFRGHSDAVTSVILLSKEQSKDLCSKLSFKNDLRLAISASIDCYIKLWSIYDGEELLSLYTFNGITCLGYLENQFSAIIGTDGGKLERHDFCSRTVHSVFAHEDSISDLQVNDSYVYSASLDGTVKVWLVEDDEFQPLYTRRRKELTPNTNEFSPTQWKSMTYHDEILYLGDNTSNLKILDWRAGRMKLLKNQVEDPGIIDAVLAKNNILLSSFYEASSDSGGINVWQLPSMTYVCTITGDVQDICTIDMTQTSTGKLRIVTGGHQLLVWDFDFTQAPEKGTQMPYYACEVKDLGLEVENDQSYVSSPAVSNRSLNSGANNTESDKSTSWCNVM